ncbi:hypothetical protein D9611_011958 [Ephemerocybe angulata]|uniref:Enoyl reductase (ER) domain-containing protein n=1 Tax=Ephemerocybe angulata TaxID=980116 RepID=A0A8H5C5T7_9AGAR|nr:hypothetical protein D9611_011958 [Tulosesus angulatus]
MASTSQKALLLAKKFGGFTLTSSFPVPKPKKNEVLVKVHAAALNPIDWKIQKYGLFIENFPAVLGADVAGEVVELGDDVSRSPVKVAIGDRVFFQSPYNGNEYAGFQQYALGEIFTLAKIPANISYDEAATIPGAFTAAYIGLYNVHPYGFGFKAPVKEGGKRKYTGVPIVILGGSSSVGQYAIQLAKLSGFSPIITTASPKHADQLKALGATVVLDRKNPLTKESISAITNVPINAVYDTVSVPETQSAGLDILESGGQIVVTLPLGPGLEDRASKEKKKFAMIQGSKLLPHNVELFRDAWPHLTSFLEEGILKPNRLEVLPGGLNGIAQGLERMEANKVSGFKLVARPQETA